MNDVDLEGIRRSASLRRGIGNGPNPNYFDVMFEEGGSPGADRRRSSDGGAAGIGDTKDPEVTFFFYPVIISLLLTVLVVFIFIKLRGFLLFKSLRSLFVTA